MIRVLLANDHTLVREATAEIINHQPDMRVVGQAETGEQAVALARESRADVAVMDVALSRLNGLEATRQITIECPGCHVLALTADEEEQHIIQLLQAGAVGYLPKTIGLDDLLEAIRATARGESVLPPSIAAVVVRHLAGRGKTPSDKTIPPVTSRELQVLHLVAKGLTNYDIAQRLYISVRTVEAHLTHIYNKLGVSSRTEAVVCAMQRQWIQPEYRA